MRDAGRPATDGTRRRRWPRRLTIALLLVAILPIPWQHKSNSNLGLAWGMDNRLHVNGQALDPPGRWSWLTVGRPALVAELAWHRIARLWRDSPTRQTRDLRAGPPTSRPTQAEPLAAAVALAAAGHDVDVDLHVSVAGPTVDGLPDQAIVTHLNGRAIHSRDDYRKQMGKSTETGQLTFTTSDGATHDVDDDLLPYRNIWFVDAVDDVDAAVGGHGPPYSWIRSMSMGSSHGLMVGLVTYTGVTGEDLAAGRHIAGTGQLHGDGTVGTIGGLPAKAAGARRAGADVLLVPAAQADQLDSFDPGPMRVLEVVSLQDAIDQLRDTR